MLTVVNCTGSTQDELKEGIQYIYIYLKVI